MKYIDSEKLIAQIESYEKTAIDAYNPLGEDADFWHGKVVACEDLKTFVVSLQQEQPKDFKEVEEAAEKHADSMGLKDFDRVRAISDFKAGVEWKERWFWADFELQLQKKMEEKEERLDKEYLKAEKLGKLPLTPEQKICKHQWNKTWVDHSDGFKKCPLCGRVETFWEPD